MFFRILDIPRMMQYDFAAQHLAVDVGIYLGCGDGFVTQHLLDGTQVGSAFQQVGGEGVAEGVGADGFGDAGAVGQLLDQVEDHDARDAVAPAGQEDVVLIAGLDAAVAAVHEPIVDFLDGAAGDGYQALLAAFALDADELLVEVEVAEAQVAQLADAQAAAVQRLNDGAVALSLGLVHVHGVDDAVYLLHGQYLGQVEADFRAFQQFGGVGLQVVRQHQEVVERLDAGQDACLRAGMDADVVQARAEALQVVQPYVQEVDVFRGEEVQ